MYTPFRSMLVSVLTQRDCARNSLLCIMATILLAASLGCPGTVSAQQSSQATGTPETGDTRVDRWHAKASGWFQGTAGRVDRFFVDDEYATHEDNQSRLRLRLNTDYVENGGWDVGGNIKLHLVLPGLDNRMRLVINDADDNDTTTSQTAASGDDSDIALRWLGIRTDRVGLSFDLGVRIKDSNLAGFGRINAAVRYPLGGKWTGATSNRIYAYSDTGFRNDFRQYFDRQISDKLLFRSRTRIQYFEENDYNPTSEQKFTLFYTLNDRHALAYEALFERYAAEDSLFDDDEITVPLRDNYKGYQLRVRYRTNVWRKWLFLEFWPIASWPEERDYDLTLGARLRVEINFGQTPTSAAKIDE